MRWSVSALAIMGLLAACGSAPTEEAGAPLPQTTAPAAEEAGGTELRTDSTVPDDVPAEFPPGECVVQLDEWVAAGDLALGASRIEVGERMWTDADPFTGLPSVYRAIEVYDARVLRGTLREPLDNPYTVIDIEAAEVGGGTYTSVNGRDYADLQRFDDPVLTLWTEGIEPVGSPYLGVAAGTVDGQISTATGCSDRIRSQSAAVADALGLDSPLDLLSSWMTVAGTTDETPFEEALADVVAVPDPDETWYRLDPADRSLRPGEVPVEIQSQLDVRAVWVGDIGLREDEVLFVRTETGVSGGVSAQALMSAIPVFFVTGEDATVEFVVETLREEKIDQTRKVLATASVLDLADSAGFKVEGRAERLSVTSISRDELADLLNITPEMVDDLRTQYLTVDEVES